MEKEEKRKKFHETLLKLYHPPSPPPHQSLRSPQLSDEERLEIICRDENLDLNSDIDDAGKERSVSDSSDGVPRKLTRAQRKRRRKQKLKEAASVRRKIIGPLPPSGYRDVEDGNSNGELNPVPVQKLQQDRSCLSSGE